MMSRAQSHGLAALLCALSLFELGCAGHESRTKTALAALDQGSPEAALAALDEELGAASADALPPLSDKDSALLLLDRGSVLQSMGRFKLSARDLGVADKAIDLLDMSRSAADDVGKYLFSDEAGPYKAPAYEKLLINTINLVNYLALNDLTGAKVEARRLAVIQKYVHDHEDESGLLGVGSYLAGFAFEKAGSRDEALNFYDEALRHAQYASLRDPLRVLTGGQSRTPGIDALVAGTEPLSAVGETGEAEIVVVIGFGRVPQKIPVRLPIGLALTMVSNDLSPHDRARANELAAKGLVTWVNYPTIGPGQGGYAIPTFTLDGAQQGLEEALDVEAEVRKAWKKNESTIVLSAITRMVTRLVAGEVTQGVTEAAAGKDSGPLGAILGLFATATLAAFDTPDTRCWATLPARLAVGRLRVPAGKHVIVLGARGEARKKTVELTPGGWAVVPMMVLR